MVDDFILSIEAFADQSLGPQAFSRAIAAEARLMRDELIAQGRADPEYDTYVNGVKGAREETIKPGGIILYQFNMLGVAAFVGVTEARALSPAQSGDYRRAWMVGVNGRLWRGALEDIPAGSEVMIVNPLPYARKVEMGYKGGGKKFISVPNGIVEKVRQKLIVQFRDHDYDIERAFVHLTSDFGFDGYEVPYTLRGHAHTAAAQQTRRSRAHREGRLSLKPRADTAKGQIMSYPAVIIKARR